jgi:tetratricopeptide (TPR) repeat protein
MRIFCYCLTVFLLVISCSEKKTITKRQDYERYLQGRLKVSDKGINEEIRFWKKRLEAMDGDEASIAKLAGLHAKRFASNGTYSDILVSDTLYQVLLKRDSANAFALQSLAVNSITQHQFQRALNYAKKASEIGDKRAASLLILSDVYVEIGNYPGASRILTDFKNKSSFAYLIRKARLKDHEGDLDSAIVLIERAYERVKRNPELSLWALSNLADMYGHAGRIGDAYHSYLRVLEEEPENSYALKGIAWILLSHEKNTIQAKKIVETLMQRSNIPEGHLMLAEAASMSGDHKAHKKHLESFIRAVARPGMQTMYNRYLALAFLDEPRRIQDAGKIAGEEVRSRPTPESYDLLAWTYFHQKDYTNALRVVEERIEGRTSEPICVYHMGMVHLANGNNEKAKRYLREALGAGFELGPSITHKIKTALKGL